MAALRFEWDSKKDLRNRWKHGVSFGEAETIFLDDRAVLIDDPDHSDDEDRFLLLGTSALFRVLVVSHCYRKGGDVIRIISARKATRQECEVYERRWQR